MELQTSAAADTVSNLSAAFRFQQVCLLLARAHAAVLAGDFASVPLTPAEQSAGLRCSFFRSDGDYVPFGAYLRVDLGYPAHPENEDEHALFIEQYEERPLEVLFLTAAQIVLHAAPLKEIPAVLEVLQAQLPGTTREWAIEALLETPMDDLLHRGLVFQTLPPCAIVSRERLYTLHGTAAVTPELLALLRDYAQAQRTVQSLGAQISAYRTPDRAFNSKF